MIKLHQFAPAFGLPNASPFCMKVETYLRMAGLPYERVNSGDVLRAPKGKLPVIDDDGTVVADSSFIIDHLKARYGDPLDAALTPRQRALALACSACSRTACTGPLLYTRWIDDAGWALTGPAFFGALPVPVRWVLPPLARRGMRAELRGHGMGRHSPAEIHAIGCRDLDGGGRPAGRAALPAGRQPDVRSTPPPTLSWPTCCGPRSTRRCSATRARGRRWRRTASA
jgi:hypothetical protein